MGVHRSPTRQVVVATLTLVDGASEEVLWHGARLENGPYDRTVIGKTIAKLVAQLP